MFVMTCKVRCLLCVVEKSPGVTMGTTRPGAQLKPEQFQIRRIHIFVFGLDFVQNTTEVLHYASTEAPHSPRLPGDLVPVGFAGWVCRLGLGLKTSSISLQPISEMTTLMVWDKQWNEVENDYVWTKVPTEYKVGSYQEELFWRVMDAANGGTSKDYFRSPRDYEAFSGISMDQYKEQVDAWTQQFQAAMRKFNINHTKTNATMISNGRSYASFFPTDGEPTGSTVS